MAGDVIYPVASTPGNGDFVRVEARCDAEPALHRRSGLVRAAVAKVTKTLAVR